MDIHIEISVNGAAGPQVICGVREDGFKTVNFKERDKATCQACISRMKTLLPVENPKRILTSKGYVTLL